MYQDVIYDGIDLTLLNNVYITDVNWDSLPTVVISSGKLSRKDGEVIYHKDYGSRRIQIDGYVHSSTRSEFRVARNNITKLANKLSSVLTLPDDNENISFYATIQNIIFSDLAGGYGSFSIELTCQDPYGYSANTYIPLNAETNTSVDTDISFDSQVSTDADTPPVIKLTYTSITGGTDKTVTIESQSGEEISVTRTFTTGEVLEFDMKAKEAKVNGVLVDYAGNFWDLRDSEDLIHYTDTFTDRSVDITITYRKRIV